MLDSTHPIHKPKPLTVLQVIHRPCPTSQPRPPVPGTQGGVSKGSRIPHLDIMITWYTNDQYCKVPLPAGIVLHCTSPFYCWYTAERSHCLRLCHPPHNYTSLQKIISSGVTNLMIQCYNIYHVGIQEIGYAENKEGWLHP